MTAKYWIKLYHEILDDPKMMRMDEVTFGRCIKLFLLAGKIARDGWLPSVEDIAWHLRLPEDEILATLAKLQQVNILTQDENGAWLVRKFVERNEAMEPAEKMRRQRREQWSREYHGEPLPVSYEPVTNSNAESDTDTDTESEKMSGADAPTTPTSLEGWLDLLKDPEQAKNRAAIIVREFETLFPGHDPPSYGYAGKCIKTVSGAGRLAELLWRTAAERVTGDPLAYALGIAKGDKKRGNGSRSDQIILANGRPPRAADPEEYWNSPTWGELEARGELP